MTPFIMKPHIQFLEFDGCPLAGSALAALKSALQNCGLDINHYETINILDPSTPKDLARWGSPTILVNGRDVTGQNRGDAIGCRIYDTPEQVPTKETIETAIRNCLAAVS